MSRAQTTMSRPRRVAMAGFGTIGRQVARHIVDGLPGYVISAVSARRVEPAQEYLSQEGWAFPVIALEHLYEHGDIVVECAPAETFRTTAEPTLRAGKTLIALSSGALLDNWDLVDLARAHGGKILLPSGAMLGLDAVQAAAVGTVHDVRMITRKPVTSLQNAPHLLERGVDLTDVTEAVRVFKGTAREAAKGFPANLNVAVALSFAGVGPDRTAVEIWADPDLRRNTHDIAVDSDSARLTMTIENIPSENPKTGRITAQSVVALLRKMAAPLAVGT